MRISRIDLVYRFQGLGNLVCSPSTASSRSREKSYKEVYMQSLYKDLTETEHLLDAVRRFLDIISCAKRAQAQIIEAPIILKEGVMIKRAQVMTVLIWRPFH